MTDLEGEEVFDFTVINADEEELLSSHDGKTLLYGFVWTYEKWAQSEVFTANKTKAIFTPNDEHQVLHSKHGLLITVHWYWSQIILIREANILFSVNSAPCSRDGITTCRVLLGSGHCWPTFSPHNHMHKRIESGGANAAHRILSENGRRLRSLSYRIK